MRLFRRKTRARQFTTSATPRLVVTRWWNEQIEPDKIRQNSSDIVHPHWVSVITYLALEIRRIDGPFTRRSRPSRSLDIHFESYARTARDRL